MGGALWLQAAGFADAVWGVERVNDINIYSLLLGAFITLCVGLISFALSKFILFKTKLLWGEDYHSSEAIRLDSKTNVTNNIAGMRIYYLQVRGWEPARGVNIFLAGQFDRFEIVKRNKFSTSKVSHIFEKENNIIKVGRLEQKSLYQVKVILESGKSYSSIAIKSIEAENAIVEDQPLNPPRFSNYLLDAMRAVLSILGFAWLIGALFVMAKYAGEYLIK
jgi:hypothetical protein